MIYSIPFFSFLLGDELTGLKRQTHATSRDHYNHLLTKAEIMRLITPILFLCSLAGVAHSQVKYKGRVQYAVTQGHWEGINADFVVSIEMFHRTNCIGANVIEIRPDETYIRSIVYEGKTISASELPASVITAVKDGIRISLKYDLYRGNTLIRNSRNGPGCFSYYEILSLPQTANYDESTAQKGSALFKSGSLRIQNVQIEGSPSNLNRNALSQYLQKLSSAQNAAKSSDFRRNGEPVVSGANQSASPQSAATPVRQSTAQTVQEIQSSVKQQSDDYWAQTGNMRSSSEQIDHTMSLTLSYVNDLFGESRKRRLQRENERLQEEARAEKVRLERRLEQLLQKALNALNQGDNAGAISLSLDGITNNVLDYNLSFHTILMQAYYRLDEVTKCLASADYLSANAPASPDFNDVRGVAELFKGHLAWDADEYNSAYLYYSKAVSYMPGEANPYFMRARTLYQLDKYSEAINDYKKAIEISPNRDDYYNHRGNAYYSLEDYNLALADYSRALELDPDKTVYYENKGRAYSGLKKYNEAVGEFSKSIEKNPKRPDGYQGRAAVYASQQELKKAVADYTTAIALKPTEASFFYARGGVYQTLKEIDSAMADFNKAIKLDSSKPSYYEKRALILTSYLKQYEKAKADLKRSIQLDPSRDLPKTRLAYVLYFQKDYINAYAEFSKLIERKPSAEYYRTRAKIAFLLNDYRNAENNYSKAIELYPKDYFAMLSRGKLYLQHLNEREKAKADFQYIIDSAGDGYPKIYAYFFLGQKQMALEAMNALFEKNRYKEGWLQSLYFNMACLQSLLKDEKQSIKYLTLAIENGFNVNYNWETDSDLGFVRSKDSFKQLLRNKAK